MIWVFSQNALLYVLVCGWINTLFYQSFGASCLFLYVISEEIFAISQAFTKYLPHHRSRETRINLLFQFVPEKLGRFKTQYSNFLVFKNVLFISKLAQSQVCPISRCLWPHISELRFPTTRPLPKYLSKGTNMTKGSSMVYMQSSKNSNISKVISGQPLSVEECNKIPN